MTAARLLRVTGVVQGVGFRPHVHRLATFLDLVGNVRNDGGSVAIHVQGQVDALDDFCRLVVADAPPLAEVVDLSIDEVDPIDVGEFVIVRSTGGATVVPGAPPDTATCDRCLAELADPTDRRFRHPFITCTDCGPRFSIITALPYDRPATTMAAFAFCASCGREYRDPSDRRFHAQPIACHECGPAVAFGAPGVAAAPVRGRAAVDAALERAQQAIVEGRVVAVKGIGGYHLACRADDAAAVARLRDRKRRPGKPFALLVADLEQARRIAHVSETEARVLSSRAAPIVLLERRDDAPIADEVAPGNPLVGIMLASNPLHRLLVTPVPGSAVDPVSCVVLTSGNLSDEPLCIDDEDAATRLASIADDFLWHDRPIAVACDDSVVRVLGDGPMMVRRSRGYVPGVLTLPVPGDPVLALGAELKATVCISDGRQAWLSPHIGDLGSLPALHAFEAVVERSQELQDLRPDTLAIDAHPGYTSHGWAITHAGDRAVVEVQHHHAHVAAVMAEHGLTGPVLGIAFDGTGFGTDGTIWGGEVLRADLVDAERVAHLSSVLLPGGDAAVRHPRRVALAHLLAAGIDWEPDLAPVHATPVQERQVLARQFEREVATVPTSSMGRLFDAVSSLLDIRHDITFEAQAAIELEIVATRHQRAGGRAAVLDLPLVTSGAGEPAVLDAASLVADLVAHLRRDGDVAGLALGFHRSIAGAIVDVAIREREATGAETICLTGGVFANALLMDLVLGGLGTEGFDVRRHHLVPTNDGGIALGQAAVAVARTAGHRSRA